MSQIFGRSEASRRRVCGAAVAAVLVAGCGKPSDAGDASSAASAASLPIVERLKQVAERTEVDNDFFTLTPLYKTRRDVSETATADVGERIRILLEASYHELRAGDVNYAVDRGEAMVALADQLPTKTQQQLQAAAVIKARTLVALGLAQLRFAELENCCARHTPESCVMPIRGRGIHTKPEGSNAAIKSFMAALRWAPAESDDYWTARWLLNVAHMTIGSWPHGVPQEHRVTPDALGANVQYPRLRNIASSSGLTGMNHAGGASAEDFDADGLTDIAVSSWDPRRALRIYGNDGDGTFTERGKAAGVGAQLGGLNIVAADYDNDGDPDLLVLRGAWIGDKGRIPNSLLRNDGGVFVDVTAEVGLTAAGDYPTQTAAFADYDGDGDLDFYVGNEADPGRGFNYPSQLFRNDGGRFVECAKAAGVENVRYAKGVAWGDYDDDGDPDLYVSNLDFENRLYRNNGDGTFTDVAPTLGVTRPIEGFPCWFFDANNDGRLDIFAASFFRRLAPMVATYCGKPAKDNFPHLYLATGDGKFKNVSEEWGLTRAVPTMGANFGDLENDGWPDVYLATGSPNYESLTPNVMFANAGGKGYRDVTCPGGFGILQKGHGVAFADFDGDGDLDVFAETGGAYANDTFHNSLFENPGFGNRWVRVKLSGVKANRPGYGARIRAVVDDAGVERSIYAFVGCVASFGSNPAIQHLGLGKATKIKSLEVRWPRPSKLVQTFKDLDVDQAYEVVEGAAEPKPVETRKSVLRGG